VVTVWREPDDGRAERLGLVVTVWGRRAAKLRFTSAAGREEQRIQSGSLVRLPLAGDIDVTGAARGHGQAGPLGVLIDARGRPLPLPHRDAERLPVLVRWHQSAGAFPGKHP